MTSFCPYCGELPNREPVECKTGYYIECSACRYKGPVRETEEEAWLAWREGDQDQP